MKQKEIIDINEKELTELKQKYDELIDEWKTKKYDELKKEIDSLHTKWNNINEKIKKLKIIFVEPCSTNAKNFVRGFGNAIDEDIRRKIKEMDIPSFDIWNTPQKKLFSLSQKWFNNLPEIKKLRKEQERVFEEITNKKTSDYRKLEIKKYDFERNIRNKEKFIENLKDLGFFREYAKQRKKAGIETQQKKEQEEKMPAFEKWLIDNYKKKMTENFHKKYGDIQ